MTQEKIQRYIVTEQEKSLSAMYIAGTHEHMEKERKDLERSGRYDRVFVVTESQTFLEEIDAAARKAGTTLEAVLNARKAVPL